MFTAAISKIATVAAKGALGLAVVTMAVLGTTGTALADEPGSTSDIAIVVNSFHGVPDDALHSITDTSATCMALGYGYYNWSLDGRVDGTPITVDFITRAYDGAGEYHATSITDQHGGMVTVETGDLLGASNRDDTGTFTVDEGELSTGTIDAVVHTSDDRTVRVLGTWSCAHR